MRDGWPLVEKPDRTADGADGGRLDWQMNPAAGAGNALKARFGASVDNLFPLKV